MLNQFLSFKNGKTSPDRTEAGNFPVFGSNGEIGRSDSTNAPGPLIVIGRVGSYCGSLFYSETDAWVTDNAIVCSSKNSHDIRYWYYALQTLDLNGRSSGSGQPLLNQGVLGSIAFNPPAIADRQAIAEVLGALDDKIAANTKLADVADELAITLLLPLPATVALSAVVRHHKNSRNPEVIETPEVAHFSLPAFDALRRPELTSPADIKSSKFSIDKPSVLVSKLNPRFPRVWDVAEIPSVPALASTEFLVLEPLYSSTTFLWGMLSQPGFGMALESKVAGTSGSHQRVKPADLLETLVLDPREVAAGLRDQVTSLGRRGSQARIENSFLTATRDALLPQLMSGKLRVRDAEKVLEDVGV